MNRRWILGLAAAALLARGGVAQSEEKAFPPHRIIGNIYYVGSEYTAVYLVATPQGHILINSGFAETVPLVRASVEQLGFKFGEIKVLLGSHAHNDHVAGHALVRRLTGASVRVMEGDEGIIRTGGRGDFQYDSSWEACPVDEVLRDGDEVRLGGSVLTARKTPGHTRGCTTWTMKVAEGGKERLVVIIGSPNVNPGYQLVGNKKYPGIAGDYEKTFKLLRSLPCDVFLGAHGSYYDMAGKHPRLKGGNQNPFIDPQGYARYVLDRYTAFKREQARQEAARR